MDDQQNREAQSAYIEGRNPVWEALKAGRPVEKLLVAQGIDQGQVQRILAIARREKIKIEFAPRDKLDRLSQTGRHQGVMALSAVREYDDFADTLDAVCAGDKTPFLVVLDEIMDPHNLGAIIRSAECAGAQMVVVTARNGAGLTPVVERASAGAVAHMPVCKVTNLARALEEIKKRNIWVAGADMDGKTAWECDLKGPLAIVVGNEGQGIRRLVREKCDFIISLPLQGQTASLNASVAAGILLYEALRQRMS